MLSKAAMAEAKSLRIYELKWWESEEENSTIGKLGNTFFATAENVETHVPTGS